MIKGNSLKTEFKRRVRKNTQELVVAEAEKATPRKITSKRAVIKSSCQIPKPGDILVENWNFYFIIQFTV